MNLFSKKVQGIYMEIKLLEEKDGKMKFEISDMTFANLLNDKLWELGKSEYSAWKKDHPYISTPNFLIKAKDSKAALVQAAEEISKDAEKIKKNFEKAV